MHRMLHLAPPGKGGYCCYVEDMVDEGVRGPRKAQAMSARAILAKTCWDTSSVHPWRKQTAVVFRGFGLFSSG